MFSIKVDTIRKPPKFEVGDKVIYENKECVVEHVQYFMDKKYSYLIIREYDRTYHRVTEDQLCDQSCEDISIGMLTDLHLSLEQKKLNVDITWAPPFKVSYLDLDLFLCKRCLSEDLFKEVSIKLNINN